jgi:hypothetical protein
VPPLPGPGPPRALLLPDGMEDMTVTSWNFIRNISNAKM